MQEASAGRPGSLRTYGLENSLAQFGCSVTLYSDRPVAGGLQGTEGLAPGAVQDAAVQGGTAGGTAGGLDGPLQGTVRVELAALGTADDPFAELPVLSLRTVLQQTELNR